MPNPGNVPGPFSVTERISASLDNWKRKLLDLSKRNRALNFKMNRVSTVAIVGEPPAEIFRRLYLQEKAMRFKPAPPPAAGPEPEKEPEPTATPEDVEEGPAFDFVVSEAGQLAPHPTDNQLQTASSPEQLSRSLRRLDELARSTLEE